MDRLHYQKDPCVKYDSHHKLWIYLHRNRNLDYPGWKKIKNNDDINIVSESVENKSNKNENTNIIIEDVPCEYMDHVDECIAQSGDVLRLSIPDKKLIALAYMLFKKGKNVKVISDDYTIQNSLKIMNIPFSGVVTEGINEIYNWKKVCQGCKHEFDMDYPYDDCEICGSKIFKKRIKVKR